MLLEDMRTYLAAQSTRLTSTNITLSFMPDTPDTVCTLYESGGVFPLHFFTTSTGTRGYERPGLQTITRSTSYKTARLIAGDIYRRLDEVANVKLPTSTGTYYVRVGAVQSPFLIDRDRNDRFRVGCNFDIIKSTG
jgi:hypothetical protein